MTGKQIRDKAVRKAMLRLSIACNEVNQYIADAVVNQAAQDERDDREDSKGQ